MAQRITEKDLEGAVERLNSIFGYKRIYIKSKAEYKGAAFSIGYAYGGARLEKYNKKGSGMSDVSPRGTKSETYDYIWAMIEGISQYKRRNK